MRISASGLARLAKCRAVAVLPWASAESGPASYGTIVHAYLKDVATLGADEALMRVPFDHQAACDAIDLDKLPASEPGAYAFETGFVYDAETDTADELSRGADRLQPNEGDFLVTGTCDVVGITESAVVILDYKTGWSDYGPIERNWQLVFYALAAARSYKKEEAYVGLIRIKEDGDAWFQRGQLSVMDLDAAALELRRILERAVADRASGEVPTPYQGEHCKYCPAFDNCPAKKGLALELGRGLVNTVDAGAALASLSDLDMAASIERMWAAEAVMKRLWQVIDERAAARPVDLGDGWYYAGKQHTERRIAPEEAQPLLAAAYGQAVAEAAVEVKVTMTQKGLERALQLEVAAAKARGEKKRISHLKKEALEMLEEKGAVRISKSTRVQKYRPKPGELEAMIIGAAEPEALPSTTTEEPADES